MLYEYGPLKTHSVYMAYIVVPGIRDPSMGLVDTLQRIANAAKKDALLVRVDPGCLTPEDLDRPDCFDKMRITVIVAEISSPPFRFIKSVLLFTQEIIVRRRERIYDQPVIEPVEPPQPPPPFGAPSFHTASYGAVKHSGMREQVICGRNARSPAAPAFPRPTILQP